jgi:hypothetical protein
MTTLVGLFGKPEETGTPTITSIEIPIIQRDYAQGRKNAAVNEIRESFLDVLRSALVGDSPVPVGLDFVYGDLKDGVLKPLDGQQRLTTLFLLHWYVASRAGVLNKDDGWTHLTYRTRFSARLFCQRLVEAALPCDEAPSDWIEDQPWYQFLWRHDPTIQSMLVMLQDIHKKFHEDDARAVWGRLTDSLNPAISFLLLELPDLEGADDLYIKMNSRGKPLTDFENFKAHFEKVIKESRRAEEFARKVDGDWSDRLWPFRGDDDLIDDEFMRYMKFVTELCEWREDHIVSAEERFNRRAECLFGKHNPRRNEHMDFLFDAFDNWDPRMTQITFRDTSDDLEPRGRVRLFSGEVNLFESCCRQYGETSGNARVFSLGQTLLLYAVLVHLAYRTDDFSRRVRVLRNLIEASGNQLRLANMPKLIAEAENYIRTARLDVIRTFSQAQVDDERAKTAFLEANPQLEAAVFDLEDHGILRGCLSAFELDAQEFSRRSETFKRVLAARDLWLDLTGALLAVGEYQRARPGGNSFQFGTGSKSYENVWRILLTGGLREELTRTREVLAQFLDAVDSSPLPLAEALNDIQERWLREREASQHYDWRYYLVKYPVMRAGGSGIYFAEHGVLGYSMCMIRGGRVGVWSYHRDPYLLAIREALEDPSCVKDPWFTGYESNPRFLELKSGVGLRSVSGGLQIQQPQETDAAVFQSVCSELRANDDRVLTLPQIEVDGHLIDTGDHDRVQFGVAVIRKLTELGF